MGFINPYIYILFVLLLPVKFSRWMTLILAFSLGLIIDAFSNTSGIHAFSIVLIAFLRAPVIKIFTSIEEGANPVPSFNSFGVAAFIKYVVTLVVIHHTTFFLLEIFEFENIGYTLMKIILNAFFTITIILGIQSLKKE